MHAFAVCTVLGIALGTLLAVATAQAATPREQAASSKQPSNAQLADAKIEARVEKLLRQMTLEEKIGQLVQYNDTGDDPGAAAEDGKQDANKVGVIIAINPVTANHINSQQLAAKGQLGSMLNTIGAQRTNMYQHLAVEKSRLHIPLLFGADVIHGFRTIYPVPLGLAASWDPQLVVDLSRMSAEEASTAGVRWFYSPMVDISRDPRWGRTTEGAGEDPYLGAAMARAYIRGYQGDDLSNLAMSPLQ
jgi:beta-glucosidase